MIFSSTILDKNLPNLGPSEAIDFSSNKSENGESNDMPSNSNVTVEEKDTKSLTDLLSDSIDSSTPSIENAVTNLLLEPNSQKQDSTSQRNDKNLEKAIAVENEKSPQDEVEEDSEEESENESEIDAQETDSRSPEEIMDELIENAFLQALKTTANAKKLELPVLTSNFYRLHMLPACPSEIGGPIDIKKSSYKKLGKFLSKMVINIYL